MKLVFLLIASALFAGTCEAGILQAVCTNSGKHIIVDLTPGSGSYLGASVRDSQGNIEDIPPEKLGMTDFHFNMRFHGEAVQFRVSTWRGYDGQYMQDRIHDTGWLGCGK